MKTQTIKKKFATLRKAETFQNNLYNKYGHVRLISAPMSEEEGLYVWEVGEPL